MIWNYELSILIEFSAQFVSNKQVSRFKINLTSVETVERRAELYAGRVAGRATSWNMIFINNLTRSMIIR